MAIDVSLQPYGSLSREFPFPDPFIFELKGYPHFLIDGFRLLLIIVTDHRVIEDIMNRKGAECPSSSVACNSDIYDKNSSTYYYELLVIT